MLCDVQIIATSEVVALEATFAMAVRNDGPSTFEYGVLGDVERWDGEQWWPAGQFASSITSWGGPGGFAPQAVQAIGLGARPYGPLEWLSTRGLEEGRYRLSHRPATVTITVAAGAPSPTFDRVDHRLLVWPEVVAPGRAALEMIAVTREGDDDAPVELPDRASVAIATWHDGHWQHSHTATAENHAEKVWNLRALRLVTSDLHPGPWRLTHDHPRLGEIVGYVLVDDLR